MLYISTCGTTTLSAPNSITESERLHALPRDKGEPVFAEPWEAQAFALAVKLSEQGHFTWKEWAAALANELNAARSRGEPTMVRITMLIGLRLSSIWSLPRAWPIPQP
jgi:hypothetical protein